MATVLYDAECSLCKMLAELCMKKAGDLNYLAQVPSFETRGEPMLQIRLDSGSILSGPEAWGWLLANHPQLASLGWLAEKLGIARQTATLLGRSGKLLRRLCFSCGR